MTTTNKPKTDKHCLNCANNCGKYGCIFADKLSSDEMAEAEYGYGCRYYKPEGKE